MPLDDKWRLEALYRFPEFKEKVQECDSPYLLWHELTAAFHQACQPPANEELISRIYHYFRWSGAQPAGKNASNDLATCVAVCFLEHIADSPQAAMDMPRWFSREEVLQSKEIFSCHMSQTAFEELLKSFDRYQPTKGNPNKGKRIKDARKTKEIASENHSPGH
ncbi:MAG: hypothetical protein ACO1QB_00755 [Verrucomicrobiales bacterium]